MLSLNKLTTMVQVRDNIYPVTVHQEIEISQEDSYEEVDSEDPEVKNEAGITYLLRMAKRHKSLSKVKPEKYYPAWCESMQQLIINNGLNEQDFLQLCLKA